MKTGRLILAAAAMAALGALVAAEPVDHVMAESTAKGGHFVTAGAIDWKTVLPAPPAAGSLADRADLATVLELQRTRTPEQVVQAKEVVEDEVFKNAPVLGAWFTRGKLPMTAEFFRQVDADAAAATRGVKGLYPRKRPPWSDEHVHPCITVEKTGSYPSGHASRAWLWAELLAEIFPEKRAELEQRARDVMWARVIGGAHFPTDTVGGEIVGRMVAAEMLKNPAVRAAMAQCRAEAEPFLLKKAA